MLSVAFELPFRNTAKMMEMPRTPNSSGSLITSNLLLLRHADVAPDIVSKQLR